MILSVVRRLRRAGDGPDRAGDGLGHARAVSWRCLRPATSWVNLPRLRTMI